MINPWPSQKERAEFVQGLVCCVCYSSWDKYRTFSSITTKLTVKRISLKKSSRILFLNIKKMVFFPFVKGKWKITALWRLAQLKQIILTPVLLATPSVILAAKCEACQQHEEIQPGRQQQSYISMLEKTPSGACCLHSDVCQAHPRSGHTCAGFHNRETEGKQESCAQPEQWGTWCYSLERTRKDFLRSQGEGAHILSNIQEEL